MMRFLIICAVVVFATLWIRRRLRRLLEAATAVHRRPVERRIQLVPFYDRQTRKIVMIPEDELEPGMRKVHIPDLGTDAYVSDPDNSRRKR